MKYVDFFVVLSALVCSAALWHGSGTVCLSPAHSLAHSPEPETRAQPARRLTKSGVVLLNVHQNHFCVSTKPQMYTSNVVGPINYICDRLEPESNEDPLQKLKVLNSARLTSDFLVEISFPLLFFFFSFFYVCGGMMQLGVDEGGSCWR